MVGPLAVRPLLGRVLIFDESALGDRALRYGVQVHLDVRGNTWLLRAVNGQKRSSVIGSSTFPRTIVPRSSRYKIWSWSLQSARPCKRPLLARMQTIIGPKWRHQFLCTNHRNTNHF